MNFPSAIRSKLPNTGTTIFTTMSALAAEHGAINLSQGFPDFSSPPELISLVEKYMRDGNNQYAPMPGLLALREKLAEKIHDLYKTKVDPITEITITSGGTQAIYTAIAATVHEGDEVILFTPAYDSYAPAIQLNGGKPTYIELEAPTYNINWETVRKRITQRTRMIIINTPHNPTGTILTKKDMQALQKLVQGTDILILSDEVYEHIIFDKQAHQSVLCYPVLAERSFVVCSFGKTYHNTGWKMGYCIAPENLMKEFRKVHQYLVFSSNTPIQYALTDFLENKEAYLQLSSFYQQKRDFFAGLLKGSKFKVLPSAGTYFQLLDYSGITDEKDTDYAVRLTKEIGVASIPISVFYHNNVDNKILRFCFAKGNETLEKAAEKLCRI